MEIREVGERNTVVIRTTAPVQRLPEVMGKAYGEIMQYLGSLGIRPEGPPFAMYHNMDMSNLDVEIGFPVAQAVEGSGRVRPGTIPGGRVAVALHVGPYDKIEQAYKRLEAFVEERGLKPGPFTCEFYLNDPAGIPPEKLQTEVHLPIKE